MLSKLLTVDIPDTSLSKDTATHLRQLQPGCIIFFRKNITDTAGVRRLTDELRDLLGEDLLIAIDQEGGGVWRSTDLPSAPSGMSLGASNDTALAHDVAAMIARGMKAMGANWNFAPVLDVNNNPNNPVIADRSYGQDPGRVAALGLAYANGLMSEQVAPCAKHFPGHGDTSLDSHHHLPSVNKTRGELDALELLPFRQAARAGIASIMTSHIVYPSLDAEHPATLSRKILHDILRQEWNYDGVIVTDSMGMKAIDDNYGRAQAAVLSLNAGADNIEALGNFQHQLETLQGLEAAFATNTLNKKQTDDSLARMHNLATTVRVSNYKYADSALLQDQEFAVDAWGRGISTHGNPDVPRLGTSITLLAAKEVPGENVAEVGVPGAELTKLLSRFYNVKEILYAPLDARASLPEAEAARTNGETIIFASTSRHRLRPEVKELVTTAKPMLHLSLWNAYAVMDVAAPAIISFGYRPEALEALARVLAGQHEPTAKLPISFA